MSLSNRNDTQSWRTKVYMLGTALGTAVGFVTSYLYTRAAEDDVDRKGKPERINTLQAITLSLAVLGIVRQIAELGKPPKKK